MRENETLKAKLLSKSIADYKQLVRYPDLEVDSDPFTEKPEDGSVPQDAGELVDPSSLGAGVVEVGVGHIIAIVLDTSPATCCHERCRLVGPSHSLCHAASCPLLGALQVGQPVASSLPCDQSTTVRGAAGWSTHRVHSAMRPATLSCYRAPAVRCAAGRLGLQVFQLSLPRLGRHRMCVRLGDTMTWPSSGLIWPSEAVAGRGSTALARNGDAHLRQKPVVAQVVAADA
ncbi:hypothetical protein BHE74_00017185 [Ensete ventricosum]|nr:hypothetical protein BHE74_00017185 [Ensete ventricosum]